MKFTTLGNTGITVSRLCLGCMSYGGGEMPAWSQGTRGWHVNKEDAREHFAMALDAGINFFDTADVYSAGLSEEITGFYLNEMASRDDVILATKVHGVMGAGPNRRGLSRKHILEACDNSLRRLRMDYVDLYQIHRWDPNTPIEETMEAPHDVVKSGKARYVGASSMYASQFAKAQRGDSPAVSSMQNHYNLIYREEEGEMIPQCIDQGVAVIPWSPLARGVLAGSRTRDGERRTIRSNTDAFVDSLYGEADFDVVDRVGEVAAERGVPPAQVALAWLLHRPGVTAPIVGATRLGHLEDALAAEELELSQEEMRRLEEPYVPHPVLGHG